VKANRPFVSLPGLTRQSITLEKLLAKMMDARIKSGHDGGGAPHAHRDIDIAMAAGSFFGKPSGTTAPDLEKTS
jgi:hypothetical protein